MAKDKRNSNSRVFSSIVLSLIVLVALAACETTTSENSTKTVLKQAESEIQNNRLADAQWLLSQAIAQCKSWKPPLSKSQAELKTRTLKLLEDLANKNRDLGRLETAKALYQKAIDLNTTDGSAEHQ